MEAVFELVEVVFELVDVVVELVDAAEERLSGVCDAIEGLGRLEILEPVEEVERLISARVTSLL